MLVEATFDQIDKSTKLQFSIAPQILGVATAQVSLDKGASYSDLKLDAHTNLSS